MRDFIKVSALALVTALAPVSCLMAEAGQGYACKSGFTLGAYLGLDSKSHSIRNKDNGKKAKDNAVNDFESKGAEVVAADEQEAIDSFGKNIAKTKIAATEAEYWIDGDTIYVAKPGNALEGIATSNVEEVVAELVKGGVLKAGRKLVVVNTPVTLPNGNTEEAVTSEALQNLIENSKEEQGQSDNNRYHVGGSLPMLGIEGGYLYLVNGYGVAGRVGLGASFGSNRFATTGKDEDDSNFSAHGYNKIRPTYHLTFDLDAVKVLDRNVLAYLGGGLNIGQYRYYRVNKVENDKNEYDSATHINPTIGGRLEGGINDNVAVFLDVRYHFGINRSLKEKKDEDSKERKDTGVRVKAEGLVVKAGAVYKFNQNN